MNHELSAQKRRSNAVANSQAKPCKVDQSIPKHTRKGRLNVTKSEILSIQKAYIAGDSIRKISRDSGRDQATVSKIVKLPDFTAAIDDAMVLFQNAMLEEIKAAVAKYYP